MSWTEEELKVIQQVFDWADNDGDGQLSAEDLRIAMEAQSQD